MKAVHFGAGNIGRGFVGLLLAEGGYELVFSDVAAGLVDALNAAESYTVHEAGPGGSDTIVRGFRAVNSAKDPDLVAGEVATADVVTTAVGPSVLRFIAPVIAEGLARRDPAAPPVAVMACENAIGATETLRQEVAQAAGADAASVLSRAHFAGTAVDRIVPAQPEGAGIDVTVEPYFEWTIERGPFDGALPRIPRAHFVDDLAPYIERKLFTVNTGHAATAYLGAAAGYETIAESLADATIGARVAAALEETSAVLQATHGAAAGDLATYRATILERFRNPALPDTVWRVGRAPLRKLSRHERFIGPAARAAELGTPSAALLTAIGAALAFDDPSDDESVTLRGWLGSESAEALTTRITGLDPAHPLFASVTAAIAAEQRSA